MTLRIDDFKAALGQGGARANLFRVNMNFPNATIEGTANTAFGSGTPEALSSFMIKTAAMPGRTIGNIPVNFRGRQLKVSGDTTYDDWTITVTNDNNFAVRNAFERWQEAINGAVTNVSGLGVNAASFNTYVADLEIEQIGRDGAVIKRYVMKGAWPTTVDPIDVSYDNTDQIEEFGVTLCYQWWESDTTVEGSSRTTSDIQTPAVSA
jgi:hypothetical protein